MKGTGAAKVLPRKNPPADQPSPEAGKIFGGWPCRKSGDESRRERMRKVFGGICRLFLSPEPPSGASQWARRPRNPHSPKKPNGFEENQPP